MKGNKKKRGGPTSWRENVRWLIAASLGPARWVWVVVLLAASLVVGTYVTWQFVADTVVASPDYQLLPDQVQINAPPEWIRASADEIKTTVLRGASLNGPLSVLSDDLVERISDAFRLHPWVARVERISKHVPARVDVVLEYRRPVLMVEVTDGLYPIDAEGVLLPTADFSPVEAQRYPKIHEPHLTWSECLVGTVWPDQRVIAAGSMAVAIENVWSALGLSHLELSGASQLSAAADPTFDLVTQGGTRIRWGRSPGGEYPGEASYDQKLARLLAYAEDHGGTLDASGPHELDVRRIEGLTDTVGTRGPVGAQPTSDQSTSRR